MPYSRAKSEDSDQGVTMFVHAVLFPHRFFTFSMKYYEIYVGIHVNISINKIFI